jgi:chloramphenicol-sensitive protein RarD
MSDRDERSGLALALLAYGAWGVIPIYWKQLGHVAPAEILAHRVAGSVVIGVGLLAAQGARGGAGLGRVRELLATPSSRRALVASTALIAVNWGLFIAAVASSRIAEASLGYYMNPLLNALLGSVVLRERIGHAQRAAIALAGLGVGYLAFASGRVPWLAIALAGSFSLYGLVRKRAAVSAMEGFTIETLLASPLALGFLATRTPWLGALGTGDARTRLLLLGAGAVTAVPLLAFAGAAKRLRYTTLGMVQFLAPTLQLACAVLLYGEAFTRTHAVAFGLIGAAVALYAWGALRTARDESLLPAPSTPTDARAGSPRGPVPR